jgi:hypothetical protein
MFNISGHKDNANQHHDKFNITPLRMAIIKKKNIGKDVRKSKPSYTIGRECKFVQPPWKTLWRLLKKLKSGMTTTSSKTTPRDILKGT